MNEYKYLLLAALAYAVSGKPVFPCRVKDKAPLIPGGFRAASEDAEQLRLSCWTLVDKAAKGLSKSPVKPALQSRSND